MDYKERIKELRDTLNAHGYRYYVLDEPTIYRAVQRHFLQKSADLIVVEYVL